MKLTEEEYETVIGKTDGKCGLCGNYNKHLEIHHLITKGSGGSDLVDNLIPLCSNCHTQNAKSAHRCNATLKWLQAKYIIDRDKCIVDKEGRKQRKLGRASINKRLSEKRKLEYKKMKEYRKRKKI